MADTVRTPNKLLKEIGRSGNTEVTRYKGKYHLLRTFKNGMAAPLVISKNAADIKEHINIYMA